ncbi:MAG: 3'-5' exonuclease [Candidatus Thorarchaeota archaeon]
MIKIPYGPFILVDTETTGLKADIHEIIQVGALAGFIDERGGRVTTIYQAKIIPEHIERAEPRALEINGYDVNTWIAEGLYKRDVISDLLNLMEDRNYIGFNNRFDLGFITAARVDCGFIQESLAGAFDVQKLARKLSKQLGMRRHSLDIMCDRLGITAHKAHDALGDCWRTWELMWKGVELLDTDE